MNFNLKSGAVLALIIAVGVLGALKANEMINKAKTVPPASTTKS